MIKNSRFSVVLRSFPEWTWILVGILALMVFNFDDLSVRINEINYWDEANYIIRGKELVNGILPEFSWSPLTSVFFGLIYLPLSSTANWLPIAATIGRFILFGLMGFSLYLLAREIDLISRPILILGMALVYPAMLSILAFQSDAVFAITSAFALLHVLHYRKSGLVKHLWLASLFCGLSALARNDGIFLFVIFLLLILFGTKEPELSFWRKLAASSVPFVVLVGGYLLIYSASVGHFYAGTMQRSYVAFNQAQYFIYPDDPNCEKSQLRCAVERSEQLYGTGEENNNSVLKAISNNPKAFLDRLKRSLKQLPGMAFRAYGGKTTVWLILFVLSGVFGLAHSRHTSLLLILIGWMFYLPIYLFTFFRAGYFYLPYYALFVIGMVGVYELFRLFGSKAPRIMISGLLATIILVGLYLKLDGMYLPGFVLIALLWFGYWMSRLERFPAGRVILVVLVLLGGMYLHGEYSWINFHPRETLAEEEAIRVLFNDFDRDSLVAAGAPGAVASAQMEFAAITSFGSGSAEGLYQEFVSAGIQAVYVDHYLTNVNANYWALIEPLIGDFYERIYSGDQGSIQVLYVIP